MNKNVKFYLEKGLLMEKFNSIREICLRYSKLGDPDSEVNNGL